MKKLFVLLAVLCLVLSGCAGSDVAPENTDADAGAEAVTVQPLPDTTMDNLTDAILHVSLEEGDAYVDDTGKMQMDLTIYSYDKFDMVDIAALKPGDTLVTSSGDIVVETLEKTDSILRINGGLDNGGIDLVNDESGIYYETGFNDAKNFYEVGEATIRVSVDFLGTDNVDGETVVDLLPGGFLIGEVTNYNFTPYNTTIRVEEGQIISMERIFTP